MSQDLTRRQFLGHPFGMEARAIIRELGGVAEAARRIGAKRTAVSMWKKRNAIPLGHLPAIARLLGKPLEDVWPRNAAAAEDLEAA